MMFTLLLLAASCLWGATNSDGLRSRVGSGPSGTTRELNGPEEGSSTTGVTSIPLLLELLGTALDSGLTIQGALRAVANVAEQDVQGSLLRVAVGLEIGASWQDSWDGNLVRDEVASIHDALSFGALTGASAAPLLYAEAQQRRRSASRSAEKRAAALGVKLVIPLGLCSLPAFIALGVVPVVMAMVPAF